MQINSTQKKASRRSASAAKRPPLAAPDAADAAHEQGGAAVAGLPAEPLRVVLGGSHRCHKAEAVVREPRQRQRRRQLLVTCSAGLEGALQTRSRWAGSRPSSASAQPEHARAARRVAGGHERQRRCCIHR